MVMLAPNGTTPRLPPVDSERTFSFSLMRRSILSMSISFATGLGTVLFDHLVDAGEHHRRHFEVKCLRHDQVNDEVELGRLLDPKIGLRPPQNRSTKSPARRLCGSRRLLVAAHHRLRLLTFPMRAAAPSTN